MQQYNLEELMNSVTAESVAEYAGIEMQSHGKRKTILCPNPNHIDRHFGNCFLTPQGYICYACGAKGGIVDLIANSLQISKKKAMDIIAESTGEPAMFVSREGKKSKNQKTQFIKVLPDDKLNLIGLAPAQSEVRVYTRAYYEDEDWTLGAGEIEEWFPGDKAGKNYTIISKLADRSPLKTLAREEPNVYQELIRNKAKESIEQYEALCALICNTIDMNPEFRILMERVIQSIVAEIEEILIEHGGQIKKNKHIFGKLRSVNM